MSLADQQRRVMELLEDVYHNEDLDTETRKVIRRYDERPFDILPDPDHVFIQAALSGLDSEDEYQVDATERATWTLSLVARNRTYLLQVLDILFARMREWRRPFTMDSVVYSKNHYAVQVELG